MEGIPFCFPFTNDPYGHGLDSSSTEPSPNLFPQEWTEKIPHEPVQYSAGLLGIHFVHVNGTRRLKRLFHGFLGPYSWDELYMTGSLLKRQ